MPFQDAAPAVQRKQTPGRRLSRVSSTDAPSDMGDSPTASTAAFAYEGQFNKLGIVCVAVLSATKLDVPPKVQSRQVSLPLRSKLTEGRGAYWTVTINGGMTRRTTGVSRYAPGLPLQWPDTHTIRFYALTSRRLVLTCRCCDGELALDAAVHKENSTDPCLAAASIPLGTLTPLPAGQGFPYLTSLPDDGGGNPSLSASGSTSTTVELTPHGQVTLKATFNELPCRLPVTGDVAVAILQASQLPVSRGQLVMCAVKSDGRSQGCTSEVKAMSSSATIRWPKEKISYKAQSAVDLELHLWSRIPGKDNSLLWLAYGIMPLGYCTGEDLMQEEPVKALNVSSMHETEVWVPLEPQGSVQIQVQLLPSANSGTNSSRKLSKQISAPNAAIATLPESEETTGKWLVNHSGESEQPHPAAQIGEARKQRKKSDPTWSDLMAVMKDRVELRREVAFLHEELRDTKFQLAACEYEKQQLQIENRMLRGKLHGKTMKMERLATKATKLELKSIMQQSTNSNDGEEGYHSAF